MKNKIILAALITATIFGCTKEDDENSNLNSNGLTSQQNENISILRNGDSVKGSRSLYEAYEAGISIGMECREPADNCLNDVVITSSSAYRYEQLKQAIKIDNQIGFFLHTSYSEIFDVDEIPHIQDGLEKGHIKIKIVRTGSIDYCLFIKPQHEKFDFDKLTDKTIMAIPVTE